MVFKICGDCGAHLDAGEACDCQKKDAVPGGNDTEDGSKEKYSIIIIAREKAGVNGIP